MTFAEAIGHPTAKWGEQGVSPLEEGEDDSPISFVGDGGDVCGDGSLHRAEHLPVEVVQEGNGEEEGDEEPHSVWGGFRIGDHGGGSWNDETRNPFFRKEIWVGRGGRRCLAVKARRWSGDVY